MVVSTSGFREGREGRRARLAGREGDREGDRVGGVLTLRVRVCVDSFTRTLSGGNIARRHFAAVGVAQYVPYQDRAGGH